MSFVIISLGLMLIVFLAVLRNQTFKYTEYCTGERELYDLTQDPFELDNVAGASPGLVSTMGTRLRELNEEWPATIPFDCGPFDDDEEDGD